jgi:hypothetical protein
LGVVLISDRRQYSLRFHRVGGEEGIMAKELGITPEEMAGRKRTTEFPPTWVLLDLGRTLDEVQSAASGSVENEEDESSAVYSSLCCSWVGIEPLGPRADLDPDALQTAHEEQFPTR